MESLADRDENEIVAEVPIELEEIQAEERTDDIKGELKTAEGENTEEYSPTEEEKRAARREERRRFDEKRTVGNNYSCCGNNCIFPTDAYMSIFITLAYVVPSTLFLVTVVPRNEWFSYVIVIVLVTCALLCNYFAVSIDPGIIPPAGPEMWNRPRETVVIDGKEHNLRVCHTCYILKPPRSSHCPACDYCVEDYDHHCTLIGSCVAKRTWRFFAGFFITIVLLATFAFIRCIVRLSKEWSIPRKMSESHFGRWEVIATMLLTLYSLALGCFCMMFVYNYLDMACRRTNLKQEAHGTYVDQENPLDTGNKCLNCLVTFFGPLGKSAL